MPEIIAQLVKTLTSMIQCEQRTAARYAEDWAGRMRLRDGMRKTNPFYLKKEWRRLRRKILDDDKNECYYHKQRGSYARATFVHHVNHLDKHPELALSKHYKDTAGNEKRNLLSVCKECHETVCHPERLRHTKEPLTEERW